MNKKYKVLIVGCGRIARAVKHYFKQYRFVKEVSFLQKDSQARDCDLIIGALAGEIGKKCLALALKYKKNLIDISDIDPPEYLKKQKEINKSGILVIPGCGFSPGLVNFILGRAINKFSAICDIEVKAGSLSPKKFFYPFLWCFEDIVVEHTIASWQVVSGKKNKFPVFDGYRREKDFGIDAESYYCASGFENILDKKKLNNLIVRVVRPLGFRDFFGFIQEAGFLKKENLMMTKTILESRKETNITFARVDIIGKIQKERWLIKSYSRKDEELNSMQKITASFPAAVGGLVMDGTIRQKGLLFLDELAKDDAIFDRLLRDTRKKGIKISCD